MGKIVIKKQEEEKENPVTTPAEDIQVDVINTTGTIDDSIPFKTNDTYSGQTVSGGDLLIDKEQARTILQFPFAVVAWITKKEYWNLTDAELDYMDNSASRLFSQLFTRYADSNPDAYMLGFTLITCTSLRLMKMKQEENQEKQSKTAAENGEKLVTVYG